MYYEKLTSSLVPLNMKSPFEMWFLDAGVPSLYHLIKFARSMRYLPLFQEIPFATIFESLDIIVAKEKDIEGDPLTLSW